MGRFFLLGLASLFLASLTKAETLFIYHDADYTGHQASAEAMAMGLNTALAEVNHEIQGYQIKLVSKDHRANVKRSQLTLQAFLEDPQALLVLGGLHSPPYIVNQEFINRNGVLLMIPWAAGGIITRYAGNINWVFRVSIDDTKAGMHLARFATEKKACKAPYLLLENTAWGQANMKSLTQGLQKSGIGESGVSWFDWNVKINVANIIVRDIRNSQADCIIFVGNAIEGQVFAHAIKALPQEERLPVISHWGITGGDFNKYYAEDLHNDIDLSFIQTCFSFLSQTQNALADSVIAQAKALYPERIDSPEDIAAPAGFIHAYDIGKILIKALEATKLTGDMRKDRDALRVALETIREPIIGLVKTYNPPFKTWSQESPDAHEALGLNDLCMASFDEKGIVRLLEARP